MVEGKKLWPRGPEQVEMRAERRTMGAGERCRISAGFILAGLHCIPWRQLFHLTKARAHRNVTTPVVDGHSSRQAILDVAAG